MRASHTSAMDDGAIIQSNTVPIMFLAIAFVLVIPGICVTIYGKVMSDANPNGEIVPSLIIGPVLLSVGVIFILATAIFVSYNKFRQRKLDETAIFSVENISEMQQPPYEDDFSPPTQDEINQLGSDPYSAYEDHTMGSGLPVVERDDCIRTDEDHSDNGRY